VDVLFVLVVAVLASGALAGLAWAVGQADADPRKPPMYRVSLTESAGAATAPEGLLKPLFSGCGR
jgi:hypothetical protein